MINNDPTVNKQHNLVDWLNKLEINKPSFWRKKESLYSDSTVAARDERLNPQSGK